MVKSKKEMSLKDFIAANVAADLIDREIRRLDKESNNKIGYMNNIYFLIIGIFLGIIGNIIAQDYINRFGLDATAIASYIILLILCVVFYCSTRQTKDDITKDYKKTIDKIENYHRKFLEPYEKKYGFGHHK